MDGAVLGDAGPEQYDVVMADGSKHRYLRTPISQGDHVVYEWAGRS